MCRGLVLLLFCALTLDASLAEAAKRPASAFGRASRLARGKKPLPPRSAPARSAPEPAPKAPEPAAAGSKSEDAVPVGPGGRTRVDFDAMQIKGQTTKAGEVQILQRRENELKSLVKRRTSFREEIILSVFPEKAGSL